MDFKSWKENVTKGSTVHSASANALDWLTKQA
jgi:hypothetical protein